MPIFPEKNTHSLVSYMEMCLKFAISHVKPISPLISYDADPFSGMLSSSPRSTRHLQKLHGSWVIPNPARRASIPSAVKVNVLEIRIINSELFVLLSRVWNYSLQCQTTLPVGSATSRVPQMNAAGRLCTSSDFQRWWDCKWVIVNYFRVRLLCRRVRVKRVPSGRGSNKQ